MAHRRSGHGSTTCSASVLNGQRLDQLIRDRKPEWDRKHDGDWADGSDESFPHFCMTCERQFAPQDNTYLYCSQACRDADESAKTSHSTCDAAWPIQIADCTSPMRLDPPRDIIPRASPSRPQSTLFSQHLAVGFESLTADPRPDRMLDPYQYPISPVTSSFRLSSPKGRSLRQRDPPSRQQPPASSVSPTSQPSGFWPFSRSGSRQAPPPSDQHSDIYSPSTFDSGYVTVCEPRAIDRPLPLRRPDAQSRPRSMHTAAATLER